MLDNEMLLELLDDVGVEMLRAHQKHGPDSMASPGLSVGARLAILVEEVGEVARALTYDEGDGDNLREELKQVSAMAASWLYALRAEEAREPGERCPSCSAARAATERTNDSAGYHTVYCPCGHVYENRLL